MKHGVSEMLEEAERDLQSALDELAEVAAEVGHSLLPEGRATLGRWAVLVVEWRLRATLTALPNAAAIVRELMVPAAFALQVVSVAEKTRVVDLGCGSGCTGVALATIADRGQWFLVDRADKKVTFCRYALRRCGVEGVDSLRREEWLARGAVADVVLARALPQNRQTLRDIQSIAAAEGVVVQWTGEPTKEKSSTAAKCGSANLWVAASPVSSFT